MCPTQAASPAAESHVQRLYFHLVISTTTHGELEVASSSSQLSVDIRVSVESVVDATSFLFVKNDLENLASVLLGSHALANNFNWVHDISEDRIVHSSQSSGSWSLLRLAGS